VDAGHAVSDLVGMEGIEAKHLIPYTYPSDEELARVGVTGLFLGYYMPWDGLSNALISQANGFRTYDKVVEGSMVSYENLDNHQTGHPRLLQVPKVWLRSCHRSGLHAYP